MTHSLRVRVRRWHRSLGALTAIGVIFVVVTGIIINHTVDFKLDQPGVDSSWILDYYGIEVAAPEHAWQFGSHWLSHCASKLYWNTQALSDSQPLLGVAELQGMGLAATREALYLISPQGDLIETLVRNDLPGAISKLVADDESVYIETPQGWFRSNLDLLSWDASGEPGRAALAPHAMPAELAQAVQIHARSLELSWERVLLDLHSGRFFGQFGRWIVDAIAIALLALALSGFWLWFRTRARHH